ncbi:MAG: sigma 54-interacting transcriptional regulator [Desulfobacterota bacterium]|nr:sigma 54-interacting transcriptional regulator [Thermodesulfobacteriota bacterium]
MLRKLLAMETDKLFSNQALAEVVTEAPCGILLADLKGHLIFINKTAEKILGVPTENLLGRNAASQMKHLLPGKTLKAKNGTEARVTVFRAPFSADHDLGGEMFILFDGMQNPPPGSGLSAAPDLEKTLGSLIESFYDGVILIELDKVIRVNSSFGRITGLKEDSLLGQKVDELDGETHVCLHTIQETVHLVHQMRKSVTSMGKLKHGNEIYVTATPVESKGSIRYIVVNIRDVTELQMLKEEVSRLMALYLSTPEDARISQITGQEIVTGSRVMRGILDMVARLAQVDSLILFEGESGTGKEVLARLTHRLSSRRKGPFIPVNCAAIPETLLESELFGYAKGAFTGATSEGKPGLFELANGGVLFLDEVSEIPLNGQVKLLKVIENLEVMRVGGVKATKLNVRIIAATNRSLPKLVKEGKFREDLFYRLYVVPIKIPPLRERREDIFPLAWHFLRHYNNKFNQSKKFSRETIQILESYQWPGNVRELQHVVERMILTSDGEILNPQHLPSSVYQQESEDHALIQVKGIVALAQAREIVEKKLLSQALAIRGTTREAARLLNVDHSTVVRKVKKYGLQAEFDEQEESTPPSLPPYKVPLA